MQVYDTIFWKQKPAVDVNTASTHKGPYSDDGQRTFLNFFDWFRQSIRSQAA